MIKLKLDIELYNKKQIIDELEHIAGLIASGWDKRETYPSWQIEGFDEDEPKGEEVDKVIEDLINN